MPTLNITHPAAMTADEARSEPDIKARRWRLTTPEGEVDIPRSKGWERLDLQALYLEPNHYCLRAGRDVRARFEVKTTKVLSMLGSSSLVAALVDVRTLASAAIAATPPRPVLASATATRATPKPMDLKQVTPEATVSATAQERIARHQAHLAAEGVALPPPYYEAGMTVVGLGVDNIRRSHRKVAEMAPIVEALNGVGAQVAAEKRHDHVLDDRKGIHMLDDGRVDWGEGPIALEEQALKSLPGLFSDTLPGAGRLLLAMEPDRRARLFNEQVERSGLFDRIRARVRETPGVGQRQVFAFVGPNYGACDADRLAKTWQTAFIQAGLESGHGEVFYNPETTDLRVNAFWHADHVTDFAAGDVFKLGINLRSNDAGGGAMRARAVFWRNLCLNLILIGRGVKPLWRMVHTGSMRRVQQRMNQGMIKAKATVRPFLEEWGHLQEAPYAIAPIVGEALAAAGHQASEVARVRTAYEAIVDAKLTGVEWPVRRDVMVEMLLRGWQAEPGDTVASLVNGVTRVHEEGVLAPIQLEQVEANAGLLMAALR